MIANKKYKDSLFRMVFREKGDMPSLELIVRVLNVNEGRNPDIMSACGKLEEYSRFVAIVRRCRAECDTLEDAMEAAIEEAVSKGILTDILKRRRAEVSEWILSVYDEEKHLKFLREDAYDDGFAEGKMEGEKKGRLDLLMEMVSDGECSLERGAKKSGLTVEEFTARMQASGRKVPV